jgi:hypothetical protein
MAMGDTSVSEKYGIEIIIFIFVTYLAIFLVYGDSLIGTFPSAAPGSAGTTIPVVNIFVGIIDFMAGIVSVIWTIFTFNIPGIPVALRTIFSFFYTALLIICIFIFYNKIIEFLYLMINAFIFILNSTILIPFNKIPYLRRG